MNLADYIAVLSDGEKIDGCQLTTPDAVALARLHFPSRAYCLVADWAILDLDVTTSQLKAIKDRELIPALVYASTVIQDSKGRFAPGDWVKTTLGVSFTHNCLFPTKKHSLCADGGRSKVAYRFRHRTEPVLKNSLQHR